MLKLLKGTAFGYTILIIYLSIGRIKIPDQVQIEFGDKIGHFVAYFGLSFLWFLLIYIAYNKSFNISLILASSVSVLFGLLMEYLQAILTNYRTADWYDVAANSFGVLLAVLFVVVKPGFINQIKNKLIK